MAFLMPKWQVKLMPRKPKRPCSYPGCPRLTAGRFCEEHSKLEAKYYNRWERDPETSKRYNTEWRKIRKWYASAHPLCEECLRAGRYTPTQVVHHILPLRDGGTNAENNLMALCHSCHGRIHAERGDRWHSR